MTLRNQPPALTPKNLCVSKMPKIRFFERDVTLRHKKTQSISQFLLKKTESTYEKTESQKSHLFHIIIVTPINSLTKILKTRKSRKLHILHFFTEKNINLQKKTVKKNMQISSYAHPAPSASGVRISTVFFTSDTPK